MVLYDKLMAQYRRILVRALASLYRDHLGPGERMSTARRTRHDRTVFGGFAAETGPRYATPLHRGNVTRAAANTLSNVALASLTCWHRASHIDNCMPRTSPGNSFLAIAQERGNCIYFDKIYWSCKARRTDL